MSPPRRGAGQPGLFDLELDSGGAAPAEPQARPGSEGPRRAPDASPSIAPDPPPPGLAPAPFSARLFAAVTDLVVHLATLVLALGGVRLLGVRASVADLPALLLLLLVFSLFYSVVPLAFWGQTPGMAAARVKSRGLHGEPLSFAQASRRWLGSLLVVLSAGLLALVALAGPSLLDRLSRSRTFLS